MGPGAGGRAEQDESAGRASTDWPVSATRSEGLLSPVALRRLLRGVRQVAQRATTWWGRIVQRATPVRRVSRRVATAGAALVARPPRRARRAGLATLGPAVPQPVEPYGEHHAPGPRRAGSPGRDVVCLAPRTVRGSEGLVARLTDALGSSVVAATPTLIHPERRGWDRTEHDLLVRAQGYAVELDRTGAPVVVARGAGTSPRELPSVVVEVDAAPLHCLVIDRAAYDAAGGLASSAADDAGAVDLCFRLRAQGGTIVHVPEVWAVDEAPVADRRALHRPIPPTSPGWTSVVERHGASMARRAARSADPPPCRWVITTAVPSRRATARWGDWPFAQALAQALRRRGQDVVVQTHDAADSLSARARDIHLVLHGLTSVRRTSGQRHIVWVISHPETFDAHDADAADLVVVASERFATDLRDRTATPVEVLLQATDPSRFHPRSVDPRYRHPVTVVAKTRETRRSAVVDALEAGITPAIYGGGWRELVDPRLIVADHIDNDELPVVYSSAGVVLNDHWEAMRTWGFVSNRIFDVLACGTPIISDEVADVHRIFDDAVPTYRTSAELGLLVQADLEHPLAARQRAARGRARVLAHHTFDHRAGQLLDLLERHGIGGTPS